ncbi:unnamed protein product [Boreogadus saida]
MHSLPNTHLSYLWCSLPFPAIAPPSLSPLSPPPLSPLSFYLLSPLFSSPFSPLSLSSYSLVSSLSPSLVSSLSFYLLSPLSSFSSPSSPPHVPSPFRLLYPPVSRTLDNESQKRDV